MSKKRKKYTSDQKVQIIKKHLVDRVPLSDLCDQHGLHPTVFHRWQKAFFENGSKAFETDKDSEKARLEKKVACLEAKISKKNDVLSELMEEHVSLKKSLGGI